MLLYATGVLLISSGALCAPSDAVEVGVCDGDGCSALKSSISAIENARKELGCCTHADCPPSVTTILCAHDVVTSFFQHPGSSKVCSDFNEQCEALRVVKMNLQLSSNILGCHEREERAFLSAPSASTHTLLEDLLPATVLPALHAAVPIALVQAKVDFATGSADALTTGVAVAGGLGHHEGNVYFFEPPLPRGTVAAGQWGAVCADGFTELDADTVCKQLGFSKAKRHYGQPLAGPVQGNRFGPLPPNRAILFLGGAVGLGCTAADGRRGRIQNCAGFIARYPVGPPGGPANPLTCPSGQVAGVKCH